MRDQFSLAAILFGFIRPPASQLTLFQRPKPCGTLSRHGIDENLRAEQPWLHDHLEPPNEPAHLPRSSCPPITQCPIHHIEVRFESMEPRVFQTVCSLPDDQPRNTLTGEICPCPLQEHAESQAVFS